MADSVVRNANKEDIPIFDSDTDLGDQFFLEQDLDNLTEDPDDIIERLMNDPNALDPLDQDTTRAPEKFIEPLDAISKKMLEFEGFAEPALGGIDLLDINYVKPKAIPLKYGGSPGIEGLMKKTTIEIQEIQDQRPTPHGPASTGSWKRWLEKIFNLVMLYHLQGKIEDL